MDIFRAEDLPALQKLVFILLRSLERFREPEPIQRLVGTIDEQMIFSGWDGVVLQTIVEVGRADDCRRGGDCADKFLCTHNLRCAEDRGIVGVLGDLDTDFAEFGLCRLLV